MVEALSLNLADFGWASIVVMYSFSLAIVVWGRGGM